MPRGMPLKIATIKIWHFDGENKLGFANGTHSVTLRYTMSYLTKIYRIEVELFGLLYRVKNLSVF